MIHLYQDPSGKKLFDGRTIMTNSKSHSLAVRQKQLNRINENEIAALRRRVNHLENLLEQATTTSPKEHPHNRDLFVRAVTFSIAQREPQKRARVQFVSAENHTFTSEESSDNRPEEPMSGQTEDTTVIVTASPDVNGVEENEENGVAVTQSGDAMDVCNTE